ncbi:MAG: sigma-70 family RNA polymerase sigma factor [Planctomycetota bacterium]|jgi:RNA polymerase sigma factor (TIGR02999 family)
MNERGRVTEVLGELRRGESGARDELFRLVYDELHRRAAAQMRREAAGHTLQPTALVHEAYLKLVGESAGAWNDRTHFLAAASRAMREILVDFARRRAALKRGGGRVRITLDEKSHGQGRPTDEILAVHEALAKLERVDPEWSRVVELRFFGGLTLEEAAAVMGISLSSAKRIWSRARAWLLAEMET